MVRENRCDLISEELNRTEFDLNSNNERKTGPGHVTRLFKTSSALGTLIDAHLLNGEHDRRQTFEKSHSIVFQLLSQRIHPLLQNGIRYISDAVKGIFILNPIPNRMREYSPLSSRLESDGGNIAGVIASL